MSSAHPGDFAHTLEWVLVTADLTAAMVMLPDWCLVYQAQSGLMSPQLSVFSPEGLTRKGLPLLINASMDWHLPPTSLGSLLWSQFFRLILFMFCC